MSFFRIVLGLAAFVSLSACAAQSDNSGIRVIQRTPEEFCRGTGRSVAVERYAMKRKGVPISKALEQDGGTALINAITRAIYGKDLKTEAQAADAGTAACLSYFN